MHHTLAVPTQNGGSQPGGGGVRRLSIDAEPTRVDLVLSAATPIGLLIPPIVDILTRSGGFRAGPLAVHYQLSHSGQHRAGPVEDAGPIRDSRWRRLASDKLVD